MCSLVHGPLKYSDRPISHHPEVVLVALRWWIYGSILPLLLSSIVLVGNTARTVRVDLPPALDGVGTRTTCQARACAAQQLTTSFGNDIVVLFVRTGSNTTTLALSDSSGIVFTERLSYASSEFHGGMIREYYAVSISPLNSDNITVVPDQCCYTIRGMQVLGVSGADTSTIYDQNKSVPATVSCPSEVCGYCHADANTNPGTCSASIHSSGADFVIVATQINDTPGCGGYSSSPAGYRPPSGFTRITAPNGNFEVDYTITKASRQVEFDCSGTDATAIVVDATTSSVLTD